MTGLAIRRELLHDRLRAFTRLLQGVEQGSPRAIHRTRVAARRLRELLPILEIGQAECRRLGRALRDAMRQLGVVRELDVLGAAVADVIAGRPATPLDESPPATSQGSRALVYLAARLRERRTEAFDAAIENRLPAELRRIARRLARVDADLAQSNRHETRHWQWAVQARVANRATRLRQTLEDAGPVYSLRPLHQVRIAVKKLRYALELARAVSETTQANDLRRLRTTQTRLGQLRDTQSLVAATREAQATVTKEAIWVSTELDGFVSEWEDQCRVLHARYLKGVPELLVLCDRLAAVTDESRSPRRRAVTLRRVAIR